MKTLSVIQGSQEWLDLRNLKNTASEAPAMMGDSKYMSRGQLLQQKFSGVSPDVSAAQQRIFDKGHAAEDAARPHAELLVGEELFPAVALSDEHDWMLASFDGITILDDVIFEHKLYNPALATQVRAGELEPHYYWQLEQQLMVSGATKALFICSDLTDGSVPSNDNFAFCWYTPQPERQAKLLAGWNQFMNDLATYRPEEHAPVTEAEAIMELPAISYRMDGLSLSSNIDKFKDAAMQLVDKAKQKIETDQDFANAEQMVKVFKTAEDKIKSLIDQVVGEVQDIDTFTKDLRFIGEQIRQARLSTDKQVKERKDAIRLEILEAANAELDKFARSLSSEIGAPIPPSSVSILSAMKGKKTVASLKEAADTALAQAKIEAQEIAQKARTNLVTLNEHDQYRFLFSDWASVAFKANDDFVSLVKARIANYEQQQAEARAAAEAKEKAEKARLAEQQQLQEQAAAQKQSSTETTQPAISESNCLAVQVNNPSAHFIAGNTLITAPTISIATAHLEYLEERDRILTALEAHGVDNWSGYADALATINTAA